MGDQKYYFWNVKKRVLTHSKTNKDYVFGEAVPASIIDKKTLAALLKSGKLVSTKVITEPVADESKELRSRLATLEQENKELAGSVATVKQEAIVAIKEIAGEKLDLEKENRGLVDAKTTLEDSNKELADTNTELIQANTALASSNKELAEVIEAGNKKKGDKKK